MTQITSGVRSILSFPVFYNLFQNLVGAARARRILCNEYLRPRAGDVVVDVGCGTADILAYFPSGIQYFGFDLSPAYISKAREHHSTRGNFTCADITKLPDDAIPPCNLALSFGVLHHLDDEDARALLKHLHARLAPGGRVVTIDPAFSPGQSRLAQSLISRDRGRNVRSGDGYAALMPRAFSDVRTTIRHDLLRIPYTHAIIECLK